MLASKAARKLVSGLLAMAGAIAVFAPATFACGPLAASKSTQRLVNGACGLIWMGKAFHAAECCMEAKSFLERFGEPTAPGAARAAYQAGLTVSLCGTIPKNPGDGLYYSRRLCYVAAREPLSENLSDEDRYEIEQEWTACWHNADDQSYWDYRDTAGEMEYDPDEARKLERRNYATETRCLADGLILAKRKLERRLKLTDAIEPEPSRLDPLEKGLRQSLRGFEQGISAGGRGYAHGGKVIWDSTRKAGETFERAFSSSWSSFSNWVRGPHEPGEGAFPVE